MSWDDATLNPGVQTLLWNADLTSGCILSHTVIRFFIIWGGTFIISSNMGVLFSPPIVQECFLTSSTMLIFHLFNEINLTNVRADPLRFCFAFL